MSWDLMPFVHVDGHRINLRPHAWNYTHNTNQMIRKAGFTEWPYDVDGMDGITFTKKLGDAITSLNDDPDKFTAMNPENGWGDYVGILDILREIHEVAVKFPSATWDVSA